MTGRTPLDDARERVEAETAAVTEKREAITAFASRVESLSPTRISQKSATQTVGGQLTSGGGTDRRATVRTTFAETVQAHTDTKSTLGAVRAELGETAALALAPTTQTAFTPNLRKQLLAATENRRQELAVTQRALTREGDQIATATSTVTDLVDWLQTADETPLSALGFEALQTRHEKLDDWQCRLETVAESRQSFLHGTTSDSGQIGADNHELVRSIYEDFAVDHPVLATVTQLQETLEECQRVVRTHLLRRA